MKLRKCLSVGQRGTSPLDSPMNENLVEGDLWILWEMESRNFFMKDFNWILDFLLFQVNLTYLTLPGNMNNKKVLLRETARGIPTAAYQVLHLCMEGGGLPHLRGGGGTPSHDRGTPPLDGGTQSQEICGVPHPWMGGTPPLDRGGTWSQDMGNLSSGIPHLDLNLAGAPPMDLARIPSPVNRQTPLKT